MADPHFVELRDLANAAAALGGEAALDWFQKPELTVEEKDDASPVTRADRESEAAIRNLILTSRPDDGWLGEETGTVEGCSGFRWIVDPIDGTKNFVHGIPLWAVLVACEFNGEVVASAVHIPGLNERYDAARGHGARWNGQPMTVSSSAELAEALFCYECAASLQQHGLGALFEELCQRTKLQRGICDAYGHMLVASGRAAVVVEPILSIWDTAAPSLVVTEAGGHFTDLSGQPGHTGGQALVTNGVLHDQVLTLIAQHAS